MVLADGTVLKAGYRLEFLAAGGMSVVYRGTRDGETFLLKEAPASEARNVMALTQEKATLERLRHEAIARALDLFEEDGHYYLVLEYIEGEDLESLVPREPEAFLPEERVVDWGVQLCDVLAYLHGQDPPVIYRDLKPTNIIRDHEGRLHLVDFGIARVFKTARECDTLPMGSALFASPEHYGASQTDQRSDIFTLGATLHYLLTGGRGAGVEAFCYPPVRQVNPRVSPALEQVLSAAVSVDPSKRYASAGEMRRALVACATGTLLPAPGPEASSAGTASADAPPPRPGADSPSRARSSLSATLAGLCLGLIPLLWIWASGQLAPSSSAPSPGPTIVVTVPAPVPAPVETAAPMETSTPGSPSPIVPAAPSPAPSRAATPRITPSPVRRTPQADPTHASGPSVVTSPVPPKASPSPAQSHPPQHPPWARPGLRPPGPDDAPPPRSEASPPPRSEASPPAATRPDAWPGLGGPPHAPGKGYPGQGGLPEGPQGPQGPQGPPRPGGFPQTRPGARQ